MQNKTVAISSGSSNLANYSDFFKQDPLLHCKIKGTILPFCYNTAETGHLLACTYSVLFHQVEQSIFNFCLSIFILTCFLYGSAVVNVL